MEETMLTPEPESHSLIKHMVIKSAGKIIYDTDNLHLVTFAKNLLKY